MRILVFALALMGTHGIAQPWQQLADFPGTTRDDAAAFVIGQVVYVGSGLGVGWVLESDWHSYSYNTEQWQPIAALPASPRQYATGFCLGDTGYVFGGLDTSGALNELWAYIPSINTWEQRASLPGPGRYACTSPLAGYIGCGLRDNGSPTNELWYYDAALDQWIEKASFPGTPRHRSAGAGVLFGTEYGYVMGGADSLWTPLADCWQYDRGLDAWSPIQDLPEARYGGAAFWGGLSGGLQYMFGVTNGGVFRNSGFHFNGNAWSTSDPFPWTRKGLVAVSGEGQLPGGNYLLEFFGTGIDSTLTRKGDWWGLAWEEGVEEVSFGTLSIHPNPSNGVVGIALPNNEEVQLTVRDARGTVVRMERTFGPTNIDMSEQPPGLYTVEALSEGFRARARWIKL